jgi:hypothetical protein
MLARLIVAAAAAVWIFWFFGEMFGTIGIAVLGLFLAVTYFFVRHHFASLRSALPITCADASCTVASAMHDIRTTYTLV